MLTALRSEAPGLIQLSGNKVSPCHGLWFSLVGPRRHIGVDCCAVSTCFECCNPATRWKPFAIPANLHSSAPIRGRHPLIQGFAFSARGPGSCEPLQTDCPHGGVADVCVRYQSVSEDRTVAVPLCPRTCQPEPEPQRSGPRRGMPPSHVRRIARRTPAAAP